MKEDGSVCKMAFLLVSLADMHAALRELSECGIENHTVSHAAENRDRGPVRNRSPSDCRGCHFAILHVSARSSEKGAGHQ